MSSNDPADPSLLVVPSVPTVSGDKSNPKKSSTGLQERRPSAAASLRASKMHIQLQNGQIYNVQVSSTVRGEFILGNVA